MIHEIHGNQWTPAFCNHYSISQTLSAAFGSLPLRDTFNTLWWEPWNWHLINGEHVTGRLFITIMTDREGRIDDERRLKLGHKNKTTCSSHETWYDGSVLWDVMGTTDIHWCIQRMDKGCAGLWESPTTINNLILSNIRMTGTVIMMIKWSSVLSTTRRRLMSVQWIRFIGPVDGTWPQCVPKEVDTITRKTSSPNPTSIYLGRRLWCYDEGRTLMTGYVSNLSFLLYWILTQIF